MAAMTTGIGVIVVLTILYAYALYKIVELENRRPTEEIVPQEEG